LAIIDRGRNVAQGTPSSLMAGDRSSQRLQLNLAPGAGEPRHPDFVRRGFRVGTRLRLLVDADDASAAIQWAQCQTETGVAEEYALTASSLEDAYVRLVGRVADSAGHEAMEAVS
jgi:ABC-2 type transport system ATP-binding protein